MYLNVLLLQYQSLQTDTYTSGKKRVWLLIYLILTSRIMTYFPLLHIPEFNTLPIFKMHALDMFTLLQVLVKILNEKTHLMHDKVCLITLQRLHKFTRKRTIFRTAGQRMLLGHCIGAY